MLLCFQKEVVVLAHFGWSKFVAPKLDRRKAIKITEYPCKKLQVLLLNGINIQLELIILKQFLHQVHIFRNLLFIHPIPQLSILHSNRSNILSREAPQPCLVILLLDWVLVFEGLDSSVPYGVLELI